MQKTTEATHESPTTNPSSYWKLADEVAELSDELLMALWTAKYGGEHVRPYANGFSVPLEENEMALLSITFFLMQRGYIERIDNHNAYVQIYKPTDLGNRLLYGDS